MGGAWGKESAGDNGGPSYGAVTPSGAPVNPTGNPSIMAQTSTYGPGAYSTPTYGLTPQSGYTGLAQQLQQAFNLSPQPYAAPRTGILDMYASPWSALYGGPANPTFADFWGQDPNQGRAPPPGTPGYQGGTPNTPLPPPPPPGPQEPPAPPPAPPGPPGTSTGGGAPPGSLPPGGGANKASPYPAFPGTGHLNWRNAPAGFQGEYTGAYSPSQPGTLLRDMRAAGMNPNAASLMMASSRDALLRANGQSGLSNAAQIAASQQGVNNRDLLGLNFSGGRWMRGGNPYVSPGDTFNYGGLASAPRRR